MIAVIDDDETICQAIERLLRSHGLASEGFQSATAFLGSDHVRDYQCLILDVRMPGMSGFELRHHLRKAGYSIPTIFITGYIDETIQSDLNVPNTRVLEKPFEEQALLAYVHSALGIREGEGA